MIICGKDIKSDSSGEDESDSEAWHSAENSSVEGDGDNESRDAEWISVDSGGDECGESDDESEDWESIAASDTGHSKTEHEAVTGPASELPANTLSLDKRRLMSSVDFELLERLKAAYGRLLKDPRSRPSLQKFRSCQNMSGVTDTVILQSLAGTDGDEIGTGDSFTVTVDSLAPQAKTGKSSKIDRMTRILEGRKENKFDIGGHAGGLTNKEKLRKKNYVMVRKGKKSVANKSKESNSSVRYHNAHRVTVFLYILMYYCLQSLSI